MKHFALIGIVSYMAASAVMMFCALGCAKHIPKPTVTPITREIAPAPIVIMDAAPVDTQKYAVEPATVQGGSATVNFAFNSYLLTEPTIETLGNIAKAVLNTAQHITIVGGCSPEGQPEFNVGLGLERAQAVKSFFKAYGVDADRIDVSSVGEESLVSTVESEYWKDRRAEITVQ